MIRGRRIAFDYGDVRIGVAVCDPDGIVMTPLGALAAQSEDLNAQISALIEEYEPICLVVGEPRHLSGHESQKMESVRIFVKDLSEISQLPIEMIDERLSTVSAAARLREAGKNSRNNRSVIDSAAAAEILGAALQKARNEGSAR